MFISSAVMLMTEFHLDGFRVDLTQAFHRDNHLEGSGAPVPEANLMGTRFLREWVRTLRLVKHSVILTAEDHTGWSAVIQPQETGGIGFDAVWWAEWYHHLIGDSQNDTHNARLLYVAGFGGNEPLAMSYLAGCGLTLLAAGIPMFFMGEEVGAKEPYRYDDWIDHREDFAALRTTSGAKLFAFYRDIIRLRRRYAALKSPHVEVLHVHDANRVLAFRRWLGEAEFLVFASLNNAAFGDGYWVSHPALRDAAWIEALNSDDQAYGGPGMTNAGRLYSAGGAFNARLPANGIAVFQRI